jgi:membrane protease YdiL (CAAX protease family)
MTEPPAPPRSAAVAIVCWTVILGVVAGLAVVHERRERVAAARATTSAAAEGPRFELLVAGRAAVAVGQMASTTDALRQQLRTAVVGLAVRPVDRLAAATVVRELAGPAAAVRQLDGDRADGSPRLRADGAALSALYRADSPAVLSDGQRAGLARDLGYFGRLAVTQGQGADPAARRAVLAEGRRTWVVTTAATGVAVAGFAVGLLALAGLVVLFGVGTLGFAYVPPAAQGTVWLETFAVWLAVFVALGWIVGRLPIHLPLVATEAVMATMTAAVGVGWPARRAGLSFEDVRWTLGWHRGRGVLAELACGVVGYVAGLPVVALGLLLTAVLIRVSGAQPSHPIEQAFGEKMAAPHVLALLAAAAVLAPLLEETMFRGALYAHLRRRHRAWVSTAVVSLLFAAIHPQGWTTIPVLGSIAAELAVLREWRGSLIAPMTAHALNNGVLVLVVALALG